MDREIDAKQQMAKAYRYETKKSLDDLIRSLINGDLFDMFEGQVLPKVPITFKDSAEYTQIWDCLSNYELLSQLKTGKRAISKDEQPNLAGHEMHSDFSSKQTTWVGYCVKVKQ